MSEREVMEYDVLIVGAGPAGLAAAIRLKQLNAELNICVIEKASQVGSHILSGAVIEPAPLDELIPGWRSAPPPVCVPAGRDEFYYLSKTKAHKMITPPQMHNAGNFIVSLSATCAWLAEKAMSEFGVEVYPGFAASEPLFDAQGAVAGVRIGDSGVGKDGERKDNFAEGVDIKAKLTVLAEGARGHLTKQLLKRYTLDAKSDPQSYSIGIKELWQVRPGQAEAGRIVHTMGWPADTQTYGGSFIYHLDENRIALGYVSGLDYQDPRYQPYEAFQQLKHHPLIKPMLEGGTIMSAGARAIASGGYQSLPNVEMPGAVLIGDTAGLLNVPKIKGTHQALRSGMLLAEHLVKQPQLSSLGWDAALRSSIVMRELHAVRNIKPGFKRGMWFGMANAGWETLTRGKSPWTLRNKADYGSLRKLAESESPKRDYVERTLAPRDRLQGVYFASTAHEEDQPVHLQVADTDLCITRCTEEYGNPCTRFCPAGVYEIAEDEKGKRLQINSSNCVHCKTCDIKDPYQQINWVTPEGGSGPNYSNL